MHFPRSKGENGKFPFREAAYKMAVCYMSMEGARLDRARGENNECLDENC